ncbi:MAG: hypothetical protein V5A64_06750, partial [Candidatus Thermoplasmatota archaeon]
MGYVIFEVKTEDTSKIKKLSDDDLISRQSILTRDASSLGLEGDVSYLKVEGSEEGVKKAENIADELGFKKLDEDKASEVNQKIQ